MSSFHHNKLHSYDDVCQPFLFALLFYSYLIACLLHKLTWNDCFLVEMKLSGGVTRGL